MLCRLAHQFPFFIEQFLEQSRPLRRRFREETVTDLLMGCLITAGGGRIIVEFPDEPVTGGDMEWNFVNPDDGTFFRILLQAKRSYGNGKVWTRHCYKELLHKAGSGPRFQAVALCDTARAQAATYPLYIFYSPEQTCVAARAAGFQYVAGASLADGYQIEHLVKGASTQTQRTRNKSLKEIAPLLRPLAFLFCPPTILVGGALARSGVFDLPVALVLDDQGRPDLGVPVPPTPKTIRQRIVRLQESLAIADVDEMATLPEVPPVSEDIPEDVRNAIGGRRAKAWSEARPERWRMTFVSASPRGRDTELDGIRRPE